MRLRRLAGRLKRWLFLGHRWLGIATGVLFVGWFLSGLVMLSVGFPALTEPERRAGLPALAWDRVAIGPGEALGGTAGLPRDLRLEMLDARPVYRITGWDGGRRTVSAQDGAILEAVSAGQALSIAAHDPRAAVPGDLGAVERDQWSVTARFDPLRPFHLVALGDAQGTQLYVSSRTGEVALDTTRSERVWNWFGAVPHWIYPTPLRARAELWRDVVLWVSGIAILNAAAGLAAGIVRLRLRRRYPTGAATPYRGLAAWHHLGGLAGGVSLLAFIVSGWLSVNPNRWFSPPSPTREMLERYAGTPARFPFDPVRLRAAAGPDAVQVRFAAIGGRPQAVILRRDGRVERCCAGGDEADTAFAASILAAARRLLPNASLVRAETLVREDSYWYAHHRELPLPIIRAVFDDADATWFHIDPRSGEVLNRLDRSGRLNRWLFNGLHTLDLGPLLRHPPARDLALWLLSASGLLVSVSGTVMGWKRLRGRSARRRAPASALESVG